MEYSSPVDLRSRPRYGVVGLLFVLVFLAGLAVAAWGARRYGWFLPDRAPVTIVRPAAPAAPPAAPAPLPALDLSTLTAREATLASQLAALEARTALIATDADAAGAQAGRAEALLVAVAARRALDRGAALGALEDGLRRRFDAVAPAAVRVVAAAARAPVTLEDLRGGFDAIAPALATEAGAGVWRRVRRELGDLVVLRRADAPRSLPVDRIARARRLLDAGQVEAALVETRTLPGAARAGNWTAAAERYLNARRALDVLEQEATAPVVTPVSAAGALPGPPP